MDLIGCQSKMNSGPTLPFGGMHKAMIYKIYMRHYDTILDSSFSPE